MNKLLRKRLPRELKTSAGRYLALIFLVALGIYFIISLVGAADTFIQRTEENKSINHLEDGNFTVFIPLTEEELDILSAHGTIIEKAFYSDVKMQDGSILRMMKNRKQIDLIMLDEGSLAQTDSQAVIEKRYSEEHGLHIGDNITLAGKEFEITGIGTVPDYENPIQNYADAVVESNRFGLVFVTDKAYEDLTASEEEAVQAEEYVYSFQLGEKVTASGLREKIENLDFDYESVGNPYFQEAIADALEDKHKVQDAVIALDEDAKKFYDGLDTLEGNSDALLDAVDDFFDAYLQSAERSLNEQGVFLGLTKKNYTEKLEDFIQEIASGEIALDDSEDAVKQLREIEDSLDSLQEFADGVSEYTDGVSSAADGANQFSSGTGEMRKGINDLLNEAFDVNLYNLTSFVKAEDNVRIGASASDVEINKSAGLFAGVILIILFTYVISVFVINQIEQESAVIGALYALGVKKEQLLRHYLTLPVIVTMTGGIIGTILGFSPMGVRPMMADTYAYYSVPNVEVVHAPYLLAYGIFMPPLICVLVNLITINKKLSQTALSLMRNEQKASSYKQFNIKSKSFLRRFQIRQMVREGRSAFTVVCGILISILLVELGLNVYVMCNAVKDNTERDTHFSYQYLYKYPDEKVPEGGEEAYIESLTIDNDGFALDVNVIGLTEHSKYFDAVLPKGKYQTAVSNSVRERFFLHDGDNITLTDTASDTVYVFTVEGEVQYSTGLTIFMDIDSMRELFGRDDDYFNVVYADKELNIDSGRLYSVATKEDITRAAGIFADQMLPMIIMMCGVSALIFCIVMYLMLSVMIEKSKFSISLMKIFGFKSGEIRKLYLDGNFIVVAIGGLLCIPIGKKIINSIYPLMISNVASGMQLAYPWYFYIGIYAVIMLVYLFVVSVLMRKINKITPAEVLKDRE